MSNGASLAAKLDWFVGHNAGGALIGDGGEIDFGAHQIIISNNNDAPGVIALTNSVLTCSDLRFSYNNSKGNSQTVILKDTLVNLAKFVYYHKTAASSILFDGATLVPTGAAANFMPSGLPTTTLGAGGLVISNAYDVTAALSMTGEGGLVKKGDGALTLTGAQTFSGDVIVQDGAFVAATTFAGGLRAASGAMIDVADATFGGNIVIGENVAMAATNGVDWAEVKAVPVAKTTASDVSFPAGRDANGRHFFVRSSDGITVLYYGKQPGLMIVIR
ncbi:MAG: hypothetical protein IJU44_03635 [Kiritimatiellae bacterium]|nr:hypothetical protein [Kiritimatiellia bacterium]